jgi:nucleoside 2-deoxyribosyltransferase
MRARFEVSKRYYQRNKEMVEACDMLHAFVSAENGYTGGTRFEIEYAVKLNIPVKVHWENGIVQWFYQYFFPFIEQNQIFFLSWQEFFRNINLNCGGLK